VYRVDKRYMVTLEKALPSDDPKIPRWLVKDKLQIEAPKDYYPTSAYCQQNGQAGQAIVAVLRPTDTEWYTDIYAAYRANFDTGRLEAIPTKGVRCANPGGD
jgi:hypothetical protein